MRSPLCAGTTGCEGVRVEVLLGTLEGFALWGPRHVRGAKAKVVKCGKKVWVSMGRSCHVFLGLVTELQKQCELFSCRVGPVNEEPQESIGSPILI